jgi:ADP-ribosylation factor related protein 1
MFSLITGFWQYYFSKPHVNVLMVGLDHAGKTTALEAIKTKFGKTPGLPPSKIPPTVGMNLAKIVYGGAQVVIWDLGGQLKMRSIWEKYYEEANAVIFIVDSADVGRLEEAKLAYDAACDNDSLNETPVIIIANKQDLPVTNSNSFETKRCSISLNSGCPNLRRCIPQFLSHSRCFSTMPHLSSKRSNGVCRLPSFLLPSTT